MAGPGRPPGLPKSGGRQKGSLDKAKRLEITERMAGDILTTYVALGGLKWLLSWAEKNETEFIRQALSRLFPSPFKEPDVEINIGPSADNMSDREAAVRIAFALNKAMIAQGDVVAERLPPEPKPAPLEYPPSLAPQLDPARAQWANDLQLTDEQRRDQAVVRPTLTNTLGNYPGSSSEQGLGRRRRDLL